MAIDIRQAIKNEFFDKNIKAPAQAPEPEKPEKIIFSITFQNNGMRPAGWKQNDMQKLYEIINKLETGVRKGYNDTHPGAHSRLYV